MVPFSGSPICGPGDYVQPREEVTQLPEPSWSQLLFPFAETIYGLVGATTWTIDGETVDVAPGDAVCVRRGQIHGFQNRGDVDATFLAIASPACFGPAYFREIGEVLAATAGGPPDPAAIGAVMRRHGLTPALAVAA